jgi:hypothetical protein
MRVLRSEIEINQRPRILPCCELCWTIKGNAGAILYNFDTEQYIVVQAKVTLLATGGIGRLHIQGFHVEPLWCNGRHWSWLPGRQNFFTSTLFSTIPQERHGRSRCWPPPPKRQGSRGSEWLTEKGNFVDRLETRDAFLQPSSGNAERGTRVFSPLPK